ncbi:MAG: S-layer homology domain-containing protein [Chthonomonadales bacterium]
MRRGMPLLIALLSIGLARPVSAQNNPFDDVPTTHWAYQAVSELQSKGIIKGYPNGRFSGMRTLTRYEFAEALDRAVKALALIQGPEGPQGPQGEAGPQGEQGPVGPAGIVPEEIPTFRRLLNEFKDDLKAFGVKVDDVNKRLDALEANIKAIRTDLANRIRISGTAFTGVRSDASHGPYVDYDGRFNPGHGNPLLVTGLTLNIASPAASKDDVRASLMFTNYIQTLGGSVGQVMPFLDHTANYSTYLQYLEYTHKLDCISEGSNLTLGRFRHSVGPLVLQRPDVDTYFGFYGLPGSYGNFSQAESDAADHAAPGEAGDLGYAIDGARINLNFHGFDFTAFGGQVGSVTDVFGNRWNSPLAGVKVGNDVFFHNNKPTGQYNVPTGLPQLGQMTVDQIAGVTLGYATKMGDGHFRISGSALDMKGTGGLGFDGVEVLGAGVGVMPTPHFDASVEWAKTITHTGRDTTRNPYHNNAATFNASYAYGAFSSGVRYRYIEPFFYSPGYWGRIGNWINPTNIQGPGLDLGYRFSGLFSLKLAADYFIPTLWHATGTSAGFGGLGRDDSITRVIVGASINPSRLFTIGLDWEHVYWKLSGIHQGIPAMAATTMHPTEDYFTISTGYWLTQNTRLNLMWQTGAFDGERALSTPAGTRYTYNAFVMKASVGF